MNLDRRFEQRPPLGVSLAFLKQLVKDDRLRRPMHKLGRPSAAITSMKSPQLRKLCHALRVHSDLSPEDEFSIYDDDSIPRDKLIKSLKRVPSTCTHIVTCIIRPEIKMLRDKMAAADREAAAKAAEEAAVRKALEDEQTRKNGGIPLKKKKVPPPPPPPTPPPAHVNDGSYASLILGGNFIGPATDFVTYSRQCSFRDLVDSLDTENQARSLNLPVCPSSIDDLTHHNLLQQPKRFYYIEIFSECCMNPPSQSDNEYYYDTFLPELVGHIGRTLLIPGRPLFKKKCDKVPYALSNARVLWDCTVSTMHRNHEFSVAITTEDQVAMEKCLSQTADLEFMLSLIGAGRPRDVGLHNSQPSGEMKQLAAQRADVDEMAFFLTLEEMLAFHITAMTSKSHSASTHGCDSLQKQIKVESVLKQVMKRQFQGGFRFIDRSMATTLHRWFLDKLWFIAVKWRLVGNLYLYNLKVYSAPILTGRSSRPSTAHSRKSRPGSSYQKSRPNSRTDSRPSTAHKEIRRSSVLKKLGKKKNQSTATGDNTDEIESNIKGVLAEEDEDPIFELMFHMAKLFYRLHCSEHAKFLSNRMPLETDTAASLLLNLEDDYIADPKMCIFSKQKLPLTQKDHYCLNLLRAENLLKIVIEHRKEAFGPSHPKTVETLSSLARVLHHGGHLEASELLFRQILNWFPFSVCRKPVESWNVEKQAVVTSITETEVVVVNSSIDSNTPSLSIADNRDPDETTSSNNGLDNLFKHSVEDLSLDDRNTVINMRFLGLLLIAKGDQSSLIESELLLTQVHKAVAKSLGSESVEALDALDELASVHAATGRFDEAARIMQRSLNKRESVLPNDDERTIQSCWQLGVFLAKNNSDLDGALEKAQTLLERVLGVWRLQVDYNIGNLKSYVPETQLTGQNEKIEAVERETKPEESILIDRALRFLELEYILSWVLARRGRLRRSAEMARHCLDIRDKFLGRMHVNSLCAADRLATILLMGLEQKGDGVEEPKFWPEDEGYETDLQKSIRMSMRVQKWWRQVFCRLKRERIRKAREESDSVFKKMREDHDLLSKTNEATSKRVNNIDVVESISKLQRKSNRERLAEQELEIKSLLYRCSTGWNEVIGCLHPHTLEARRQYGIFLMRTLGLTQSLQDRDAEDLLRSTLVGREQILGQTHKDTLQSASDLGVLLFKLLKRSVRTEKESGKLFEECESLFRKALLGRDKVLGPEHTLTLLSVNQLATFLHYRRSRRPAYLGSGIKSASEYIAPYETKPYKEDALSKEIIQLFARDYEGCLKIGANPLATAKALSNLCKAYCEIGKFESALDLYKKCLDYKRQNLGDYHMSTLRTSLELGRLLQITGDSEGSVARIRYAYEGSCETLGWYHEFSLNVGIHLSSCLLRRGRSTDEQEAEELLRGCIDGHKRTIGISRQPKTIDAMFRLGRLLKRRLKKLAKCPKSLLDKSSPSRNDIRNEAEKILRLVVREHLQIYGEFGKPTLKSRKILAELLHERHLRKIDNPEVSEKILAEAEREARLCVNGYANNAELDGLDNAISLVRQILHSMGRHEEADRIEAHYLEQVLGISSLRTLESLRVLAMQKWQFEKPRFGAESVALLKKCVSGFTALTNTPTNPYNKNCSGIHGVSNKAGAPYCIQAISAMEDLANAIERYTLISGKRDMLVDCEHVRREIVKSLVQSFGSTAEKTLIAVDQLGSFIWREFGRKAEARIMLQRVADGRRIRLGQMSNLTLQAIRKLSKLEFEMGNFCEAEKHARQALEGFILIKEERGGGVVHERDLDIETSARGLAKILLAKPENETEAAVVLSRYCNPRKLEV